MEVRAVAFVIIQENCANEKHKAATWQLAGLHLYCGCCYFVLWKDTCQGELKCVRTVKLKLCRTRKKFF